MVTHKSDRAIIFPTSDGIAEVYIDESRLENIYGRP